MIKKSSFTIALTGGIGSGKSSVANFFKGLGTAIIDADEISHQLTAAHSPYVKKIADHFGQSILNADHTLNREQLRKIIFQNKREKRWLESLLHPAIYKQMLQQAQALQAPYVILVIPLLIETLLAPKSIAKRILVVDASLDNQIQRIQARTMLPLSEINTMILSQADRTKRLAHADDIIENNGSLDNLREQVKRLHQKYLSLARESA